MQNKSIFILLILFSFFIFTFSASYECSQTVNVDWAQLAILWQKYMKNPNPVLAKEMYNLLPDEKYHEKLNMKVLELIYMNIDVCEKMIKNRCRHSVRLAFKLLNLSDGAFSESLFIILGNLIRIDPGMFLSELCNHYSIIQGNLISILGNYGPSFHDRPTMDSITETRLRINALRGVYKKSLIALRDKCIDKLEKLLMELEDDKF